LFSLFQAAEANSTKKLIEIVCDPLIEAIQLGSLVMLEFGIGPVGLPGDLAAEDRGNLFGLPDRSVGIQQSLAELIQCGPPVKDQVVEYSTWEKRSRYWQPASLPRL
jgi:hypothetical protein